MNPLTSEVWESALSYGDFRQQLTHHGEIFDEVYANPAHTDRDLEWLRALPPLRVLAIGEDWCPDVYHTLPTWARLSEELPGWDLRVLGRDQYPELMAAFLWQGKAQRIPVYAFHDQRSFLQLWWSGRGRAAQKAIDDFLAGRSFADLEPDEKKVAGRLLDDGYRREFRRANLEEILTQLRAFHHCMNGPG